MSASQATTTAVASTETSAPASLPKAWLIIARVTWVVVVLPTIVLFALGLVAGFGQMRAVCAGGLCNPHQLSPAQAQLHQQLGLSLTFYAWYTTVAFAVFGAANFALAMFIFWRRSYDWMALFVSFSLVLGGAGTLPVLPALGQIQPQLGRLGDLMFLLNQGLSPAVYGLFPDGRFVPRRMRW